MVETKTSARVWLRLTLCVLIIAAGLGGFAALKKMKKPPVRTTVRERPLAVEAVRVEPTRVTVELSGLGELRSSTIVPISAEVSGRVTSVHPRLEPGRTIPAGDVLLTIDDRDFRLARETAAARLTSLRRELELARKEHERVSMLYKGKKVGTLSAVEKAESGVNAISERITQVEQELRLAELRLERCTIRAPFPCRLTEVNVERDEYVTPGRKLLTLVDDRILEVDVSLDSRDALAWLNFAERDQAVTTNWFPPPAPVSTMIVWTEDDRVAGQGRVDRVVRFDPATRTVKLAVLLERGSDPAMPLVEGMFCRVIIPGRTLDGVYVLPRHAVTFENKVYLVKDRRLVTRPVEVIRLEQDRAVIGAGLQPGDMVIITRLVQPLENTLVSVTPVDGDKQ